MVLDVPTRSDGKWVHVVVQMVSTREGSTTGISVKAGSTEADDGDRDKCQGGDEIRRTLCRQVCTISQRALMAWFDWFVGSAAGVFAFESVQFDWLATWKQAFEHQGRDLDLERHLMILIDGVSRKYLPVYLGVQWE